MRKSLLAPIAAFCAVALTGFNGVVAENSSADDRPTDDRPLAQPPSGTGQASDAQESKKNGGRVSVTPSSFDFGKVDEGAVVSHTFLVENTGNSLLRLYEATATCGCTTPRLGKKTLKPGESTELNVSIDTSMKKSAITKTVFISSNDPVNPMLPVPMNMFVVNPHTNLDDNGKAKIFTDRHCASCHVLKGIGKVGRDLYNADCAMCHGPKAEGESGPALYRSYGNPDVAAHIQQVIEAGSSRAMPGFLEANGGPLTREQIVSIVDYLKALSKARKIY